MMLDEDIVAVSPTTVWRVLHHAGRLHRWGTKTRKGTGFEQPLKPHEHWHIDVSYVNICGTFYYLCSILDGCSRSIVHWDLRESMREADIEIVLQKARERYPEARPRANAYNIVDRFPAVGFHTNRLHSGPLYTVTYASQP